jgi:hypothetical protein
MAGDEPGHDGSVGMRRGIDFEKMEAAFKRAAEKAIRGTREERSGRYIERRSQGDYAVGRGVERVRDTDAGGRDKWRKP